MIDNSLHMNPFPGIRRFEISEDYLFFGREKQIGEIVSVLNRTHFLALIGYSGCGKSSLISAGVIPTLVKGKSREDSTGDWVISVIKPGDDPFQSFAEELCNCTNSLSKDAQSNMISIADAEQILRSGESAIEKAYQKISQGLPKKWLIVIDQFEEIFRFRQRNSDKEGAINDSEAFVNLFLSAIDKNESPIPVYFILTMRSDFLDNCTEFEGLPEAINRGHFLMPRMTNQELRSAIVKPIETFHATITNRLVDRLIADVGDKTDQLPVLQHALMRVWDYWIGSHVGDQPIDINHYETIGTISRALSIHAEEIFDELESPRNKLNTEKLFKALTDLDKDKKGTRRPTTFKELLALTEANEDELTEIIELFRLPGRAFLMPPSTIAINSDTVIDISHESIMRVWVRLREWVEEETKSAELYLRLSNSAELYQQGKTGLWTNPELELALKWAKNSKPNAVWAMRYDPTFERAMTFLEYSKKEYNFEIEKKERKQKQELSRARKFAIFLGIASLVSLLFLVVSLNMRFKAELSEKIALDKEKIARVESRNAEEQRKEAISQKRISEQQQQIAEQQKIITEEQRQYALKQQNIAVLQRQKADFEAKRAEEAKAVALIAKDEAEEQKQKAVLQKQIADTEKEKAEISEKNARRLRLLAIARSMAVQSSETYKTIDSDLPALLALQAYLFNKRNNGSEKDPLIFNALSNIADPKVVLIGHKDAVRSLTIAPNDTKLVSCSDDGTVKMWDIVNFENQFVEQNTNNVNSSFRSVSYSNDGRFLAAGCVNGKILLWDLSTNKPQPAVFNGHSKIVTQLAFTQSAKSFVSISTSGTLKVWNVASLEMPTFSYQASSGLISLALGNDGKTLACGDENGVIRVFNLADLSQKPTEINSQGIAIRTLSINHAGNILAVGNQKGMILLYELNDLTKIPIELVGHLSAVNAVRFSPDGKTIASCSYDKTIRLWNYQDLKEQPIIITDNDSWVMDIRFSHDGGRIFSCGQDKTVRQWITSTKVLADKICSKVSRNMLPDEWEKYVGKDIEFEKTCLNY
jgi:WD40 repeat protein/energy-coupling factor transporter ATP-binding protein EcfA2